MATAMTQSTVVAVCTWWMVVLLVRDVGAGKILILSMQWGSHMNEMSAVSEGLIRMGHTIHVAVDGTRPDPQQFKGINVEFIRFKSPDNAITPPKPITERITETLLVAKNTPDEFMRDLVQVRVTYECKTLLYDKDLIKRIEQEHYDLVLADMLIPCYFVLPYKLNIPVVSVSSYKTSWFTKTHLLVQWMPCMLTKDTNTFFNRLKKLFEIIWFERFVLPEMFLDPSQFMNYVPEKPYSSLEEVILKTTIFFIHNQNGILDCPSPSMPNQVSVGGLTGRPPKPLEPHYQQFVDGSRHGVVIIALGSGIAYVPKDIFLKFLDAFRAIKQRVIWRCTKKYGESIPKHVKIVDWMPQNDLLAHPNVKLLITHSGNNGQTEALYHGVPMIGVPVFAEQEYNTDRIITKGFGLGLNIHDFKSQELVDKINEIMTNPKYSNAIKKASAIHRSLPDPRNTSAFWIDHVMKHGADHLTTVLSDMTFVQFLMLDIFTFLTVVAFILFILVKKLISFIVGKLVGGGVDKNKKVD